MEEEAATKTVAGFFGPKQVTREEFVKEWTSHYGQVFHLAKTTAEYDELFAFKQRIAALAGAQWDKLP
jgi:hypothetical protein